MAINVKPWERQENETPKQFEAFKIYRDMENRTIAKVGKQLGKSAALMERWSSQNSWVDRTAAWEDEQDRILRQEQIKDIKRMRERHAKIAFDGLERAAEALMYIPLEEIKMSDVSKLIDTCSKLERLSRGDTSEVVEERQGEAVNAVQIYVPDNNRGRDNDTFDDLEV